MNSYESIYKNWQEFAKGSYDPGDQAEGALLLENFEVPSNVPNGCMSRANLCALRFLDNEISLREYKELSSNILLSERQQPLNEISMGNVKDVLLDIIQVGGGVAAAVGSGGAGGDTVVDALVAVEGSTSALDTIVNLATSGSDLLVNLIEGIKKINLSSGLDGIYQSVKKIIQAIAKTFKSAKDMLDKLRDEILGLIRKALRGVEKWISTVIPDDAGTVGIAIRETVMFLLKKGGENVYSLMSKTINALPDFAKNLIFSAQALGAFLHKVADVVVGLIDKALEVAKDESLLKKIAKGVMAVTSPLMALASKFKGPVLEFVKDYILNTIKPNIPLAVKTARFIFTIFFGLVAAFQVIVSQEYAEAGDVGAKAVAETAIALPRAPVAENYQSKRPNKLLVKLKAQKQGSKENIKNE